LTANQQQAEADYDCWHTSNWIPHVIILHQIGGCW
jgi:hypothetical protein